MSSSADRQQPAGDHCAERTAGRRDGRDDAIAALEIAVEQAMLVARLEVVLGEERESLSAAGLDSVLRRLDSVRHQMRAALEGGGIEIEDPTGRPLSEVEDRVEVIGWRHGAEFTAAVVADTQQAIVRYWGDVVRPGQVIMGAPRREEHDGTDR